MLGWEVRLVGRALLLWLLVLLRLRLWLLLLIWALRIRRLLRVPWALRIRRLLRVPWALRIRRLLRVPPAAVPRPRCAAGRRLALLPPARRLPCPSRWLSAPAGRRQQLLLGRPHGRRR
jgi:hypothetical protein